MKKIALIVASTIAAVLIFTACERVTSENVSNENTVANENAVTADNTENESTKSDNDSVKTIKAKLGETVTVGDYEITLNSCDFSDVYYIENNGQQNLIMKDFC